MRKLASGVTASTASGSSQGNDRGAKVVITTAQGRRG